MRRLSFLTAFLIATCTTHLFAQDLGQWQVYPSYSTVNDVFVADEATYSATLGGIFITEGEEIAATISSMDGLYRSNPTTIIYDKGSNRIFAGYIDGMIDVIDADELSITRLQDINRVSRFNSRTINEFKIFEGSLYVATSFGVVVYDLEQLLVENSYTRLGTFNIGIPVYDFDIAQDTIYVATDQGVAVGALEDNLVESDNWQSYTEANGLQANVIDQIAWANGNTFALVSDSLFVLGSNQWMLVQNVDNGNIEKIARSPGGDRLAVATNDEIVINNDVEPARTINLSLGGTITALSIGSEQMYIGTGNEGLFVLENPEAEPRQYLPTGPYLNFFNNLLMDGEVLVSTSSGEFPQADPLNPVRGYYIFKDGTWDNYNRNTNQMLMDYRISTVFSVGQTDSAYYFGSWGDGVIKHQKSSNEITVYNHDNSALQGIGPGPDFVVIGALAADADNNMWATSYWSEYPLNVQLAGTDEWIRFRGLSDGEHYFRLFVDSNDQKWVSLINTSNAGLGLLVIDTGDPETAEDDRSVKLTSNPDNGNLPDEKINAIVEDKNGEVWIGTGRGIARFTYPKLVIEGGAKAEWLINEDTTAASRFLLRDVNVTAMAVNDANQKWIGSQSQGLWLLNEEGSRIEKRVTAENSDLLSNTIESIAINNETGQVYVATDLGLVSLQDVPLKPVKKMDKLKVFPNPFEYGRHNQVVIEGLSNSTQIKILGVDGVVVNELEATGGRVSWDGRDYNGNQLGTGVYYVVAYESSGRERGLGKLVIVR